VGEGKAAYQTKYVTNVSDYGTKDYCTGTLRLEISTQEAP